MKKYFVFLLLLFGINAAADSGPVKTDQIKIGSYYIPGLIDNADSGLFIDLNRYIFSRLGRAYSISIEDTRRAQISFFTAKTDLLFPELEDGFKRYQQRGDYISSEPFWGKNIYLYSLKTQPYRNLKELVGKRVGAVRGYSYGPEIERQSDFDLYLQSNDVVSIKKLLAGELDAFLGDAIAVRKALQQTRAEAKIDFPGVALEGHLAVFYVCHNNARGRALCEAISEQIHKLKRSGFISINPRNQEYQLNLPPAALFNQ